MFHCWKAGDPVQHLASVFDIPQLPVTSQAVTDGSTGSSKNIQVASASSKTAKGEHDNDSGSVAAPDYTEEPSREPDDDIVMEQYEDADDPEADNYILDTDEIEEG